jgi:hypothetical protein
MILLSGKVVVVRGYTIILKLQQSPMIAGFDLRIGNWITVRGNIGYVTAITPNSVELNGVSASENVEDLHPIPLTHDLLIKAGFQERSGNGLYEKVPERGFSYHLPSHKIMLFHGPDNVLGHWLKTDIVFLHQLQNFFYYLTGIDIPIKL